jgi:TIGR03009 family protein
MIGKPCFALASAILLAIASLATAQQRVAGPAPAQSSVQQAQAVQPQGGQQQPAAPPQAPAGFQLNALEQAYLDQVLDAWQLKSGEIRTFKCAFQRWEYDVAFGPGPNVPLNKNEGELSFQKPDKGSFQIKVINTWQAKQPTPGQQPAAQAQGDWVPQPNAIGEHWVCDGKSVFEYRHDQKQLVERPIPPQMQGQGIVDGPLPFLFGAEAAKLKSRYWLRVQQQPNQEEIWLTALPKFQAQAADFKAVDVILSRAQMLPTHMQVHLPNGSRHLYFFNVTNAALNNPLAILQSFFERPRTPSGWKRVLEQMPGTPVAEAPIEKETLR